ENNPTSVTLVIEKNGVPILFAPFYCQMNLAFLGFNPTMQGSVRLRALRAMRNAAAAFAAIHGVKEITTESLPDYPVAQWAIQNGFDVSKRQTFTLHLLTTEQ